MKKMFSSTRIIRLSAALLSALVCSGTSVSGQILYEENFDDGQAGTRWSFSSVGGVNGVNFAFDYSAAGIPSAPNGTGTTGLRFDSNLGPTGASSGIVAFPDGQSFSVPHVLTFDLWMNVEGTATTEFAVFGIGHTTSVAQTPTSGTPGIGPMDNGINYALTGDNGAARDVRVYVDGAELTGAAGGFAGALQSTQNAPYNEAYLAPIPGNQWLEVEVLALSDRTILSVNGNVWAETLTTPGSGNIMLGYMDVFTSVAPGAVFGVYDNVMVAVPEPGTYGVILGIAALLAMLAKRRFVRRS